MKKEQLTDIQLHVAGATVRHESPFENLDSYVNEVEISQDFRKEWVIPFYLELNNPSDEWVEKMIRLKPLIGEEVILQNLGDFNWRTRSTGSYFAAIKESIHLEKIIGTHLLKSEVCYAGSNYALTLASFNTEYAVDSFDHYLEYYLTKPELYFDQESVMAALQYLDEVNGTNRIEKHLKKWEEYHTWRIQEHNQKPESLDLTIGTSYFHRSIDRLNRIING